MVDIAWRTGVNMREFAYYGSTPKFHDADDHTYSALQEEQATALERLGVKLVRFYGSHRHFSAEDTIRKIDTALTVLDKHKIQAAICLTDNLWGNQFFVPGDQEFYANGKLSPYYWRFTQYTRFYLPHIRQIANQFVDDDRIAFWELGNEFAIHPATNEDEEAFITFAQIASDTLWTVTHRPVALGAINARQLAADKANWGGFTERLYSIPTLHFVGVHFYQHDGEEEYASEDVRAAKKLGKPLYVGEIGMLDGTGDRTGYVSERIVDWKDNKGAFTVMLWGFDSVGEKHSQKGISDTLAVAKRFDDYTALTDLLNGLKDENASPIPLNIPQEPISPIFEEQREERPVNRLSSGKRYVVSREGDDLAIRERPGRGERELARLYTGDEVIGFETDLHEEDGYVWMRVAYRDISGWSAKDKLSPPERWLVEATEGETPIAIGEQLSSLSPFTPDEQLPTLAPFRPDERYSGFIENLPRRGGVITTQVVQNKPYVVQHYGNTRNAYNFIGPGYYEFSQTLHSGVDIGIIGISSESDVRVYAGVHGTVKTTGGSYRPRRVDIQTDDGYWLIYGHLRKEAPVLNPGDRVEPGSVIGSIARVEELEADGLSHFKPPHLHLEVRYRGLIINPLLLMTPEVRRLFDDAKPWSNHFYPWDKWQTPYDQPVLELLAPGVSKPMGPGRP